MKLGVLTVTVCRVGTIYTREPWRGMPALSGRGVLSADEVSGVVFVLAMEKGAPTRHVVRFE